MKYCYFVYYKVMGNDSTNTMDATTEVLRDKAIETYSDVQEIEKFLIQQATNLTKLPAETFNVLVINWNLLRTE